MARLLFLADDAALADDDGVVVVVGGVDEVVDDLLARGRQPQVVVGQVLGFDGLDLLRHTPPHALGQRLGLHAEVRQRLRQLEGECDDAEDEEAQAWPDWCRARQAAAR